MSEHYDYVIVGGGSAGCVLANRLSARSGVRVLLCESGEDTPYGRVPAELLDSFAGLAYLNSRFLWNDLKASTEPIRHNDPDFEPRRRKYEQARVLGGGSSINGQLANRGLPGDYDEWERAGATGWNWDSVLPYFRKLERDHDFCGPLHGKDGPMAISRLFPDIWPGHAKAMARALDKAGFNYIADQNGEFGDGYYPVPISNVYDRRVSTSTAYLGPTVRMRDNLTVMTRTDVIGLTFDGTRCTGVRLRHKGETREVAAGEVLLCAGAIHTPTLLLRAGIGPADDLRDAGVEVVLDSQGVGRRLMDHPAVAVAGFIHPEARIKGLTRRHLMLGLRFSSGLPGMPRGDMAASIASKSAWHDVGSQLSTVNIWVNKTYSETGTVRLSSTDPDRPPLVDFNLLTDARDVDRLMAAFRMLAGIVLSAEMDGVVSDVFPASYSDKVRQVAAVTTRNKVLTATLAQMLDGPAALRARLIDSFILEGDPIDVLLRDEAALEAFVRRSAVGVWHASCSCRMGPEDDPLAVLDPRGRLRGATNLRVVDASAFPTIPCANTNLPTIMLAEKMADMILEDRDGGAPARQLRRPEE
ncbi:GMC family oxidoreductase [Tropicimonas sp. IMCC34011]|uniref:GMC family oxidoreductase n=1 Tax=Tropicimonas sp. IMCC34011 TaxID=2248759 RepID=UPI000E22BA50|nr:GMC family oxidoreductase N-terminal domain-containing protein [Tropicimonas sp. IMCC34011]